MNRRFNFFVVSFSTLLMAFLLLGAVMGRSASPDDPYPHLSVYAEVLSRIKSEYVEEPDIKSVTLGAVNGLLESIDPFASYLNPEQYRQYLKHADGRKANVGLVIAKKFGYVAIVDVIPGTAASRAGLATGDMIEAINGVATRDMPLAYAELLLGGEPNTSVEVSVLRIRNPEPQKITLARAPVRYPGVLSKGLPDQIGLIDVPALDSGKVKEIAAAVQHLERQGSKRFILDLRSNGTGRPEDGIALANLFLDKGLIAYVQGQKFERRNYNAESGAAVTKLPVVVLTNRGTAGGAELAAAALADNKRAELIGERTYGDASLRKAITMDDGSAVILSVAKYYSPSGKAIQDNAVSPAIMVADSLAGPDTDENEGEANAPQDTPKKAEDDAILKRAIEYYSKGRTDRTAQVPDTNAAKPGGRETGLQLITPDAPVPPPRK
ncbi:MAG TPA: S41 family peptidase [Bryobacteraceae bacterium]|nr:S41 family peptidase [Bryobacteraceae bacterium]